MGPSGRITHVIGSYWIYVVSDDAGAQVAIIYSI